MLSETQVCAGRNCASTDGKNHSPECLTEYEVATLGGKTIWDVPAAIRTSFPAKAQQAAEIMSEIQRSRNHVPRHGSETSPVMPIAEITAIILCALQGGE